MQCNWPYDCYLRLFSHLIPSPLLGYFCLRVDDLTSSISISGHTVGCTLDILTFEPKRIQWFPPVQDYNPNLQHFENEFLQIPSPVAAADEYCPRVLLGLGVYRVARPVGALSPLGRQHQKWPQLPVQNRRVHCLNPVLWRWRLLRLPATHGGWREGPVAV